MPGARKNSNKSGFYNSGLRGTEQPLTIDLFGTVLRVSEQSNSSRVFLTRQVSAGTNRESAANKRSTPAHSS